MRTYKELAVEHTRLELLYVCEKCGRATWRGAAEALSRLEAEMAEAEAREMAE